LGDPGIASGGTVATIQIERIQIVAHRSSPPKELPTAPTVSTPRYVMAVANAEMR
jgi:hypothetical protein